MSDVIYLGMTGPCIHTLPGTLIVAPDGCSLECEVCHEIVVPVELHSTILSGDEIEWLP